MIRDHTREAAFVTSSVKLGKVLRKVATGIAAGDEKAPVVIGETDVKRYLGKPKFHFEAADRTAVPGVVNRPCRNRNRWRRALHRGDGDGRRAGTDADRTTR